MIHYSYSDIGKKKVNEDFEKISQRVLIVCDGVGGQVKGELASKETVNFIVSKIDQIERIDDLIINETVVEAQNYLNAMLDTQPELEGMATTLSAVFISEKGFYSTHLGDSRVYLVRPKARKFWQTWDHSLVGNLIKQGEISREAGRNHPLNNQIFKAIKANFKNKTLNPEIHLITDIKVGDIFFICSDGISEAFSDLDLLKLLVDTTLPIDSKLNKIKEKCKSHSLDNNTAIICEIEKKDIPKNTIVPLNWTALDSLISDNELESVSPMKENKNNKDSKKKKWFQFFGKKNQ